VHVHEGLKATVSICKAFVSSINNKELLSIEARQFFSLIFSYFILFMTLILLHLFVITELFKC